VNKRDYFRYKLGGYSAGVGNSFGMFRTGGPHRGTDIKTFEIKRNVSLLGKLTRNELVMYDETKSKLTKCTFSIVSPHTYGTANVFIDVIHAVPDLTRDVSDKLRTFAAIPKIGIKFKTVKESLQAVNEGLWSGHHIHLSQRMLVPTGKTGDLEEIVVEPGISESLVDPDRFLVFLVKFFGSTDMSRLQRYVKALKEIEGIGVDRADNIHRTYGFDTRLWRAASHIYTSENDTIIGLLEWWAMRAHFRAIRDYSNWFRNLDIAFQGQLKGKIRDSRDAILRKFKVIV